MSTIAAMSTAPLTSLQFLVLKHIMTNDAEGSGVAGWQVRDFLEDIGRLRTMPAFYQLMGRMEEEGYISSKYIFEEKRPNKTYRVTARGKKKAKATSGFYSLQGSG